MKERQNSKAFGEEFIHIERSSASFEELNFILQKFQNLWKDGQSRNE
jgi:hypothetical protein